MTDPILPIEGETIDPGVPVVAGWSDAPVDGSRIDVSVNSVVAGNPDGARVEIASDGLHAYDATGAETATIRGEEGVFVGGEFRTSDTLPGQVTLSDTGYVDANGTGRPGIRIDPVDATGTALPPGIGPNDSGMVVTGGTDTAGRRSFGIFAPSAVQLRFAKGAKSSDIKANEDAVQMTADDGVGGDALITATPSAAQMEAHADAGRGVIHASPVNSYVRSTAPDGTNSIITAQIGMAAIRARDAANVILSQAYANANEAYLYTQAGGASRYLSVDANGVWVKTNASGSWKHYNLEQTAQDSGWVAFTPATGITANNTSWRNKGGVMWFRGFVTATWVTGWNLVKTGFTADEIPTFGVERPAWNAAGINYGVRMRATGDLEVYAPSAGSATIRLDGLNYPTT